MMKYHEISIIHTVRLRVQVIAFGSLKRSSVVLSHPLCTKSHSGAIFSNDSRIPQQQNHDHITCSEWQKYLNNNLKDVIGCSNHTPLRQDHEGISKYKKTIQDVPYFFAEDAQHNICIATKRHEATKFGGFAASLTV